MSSVILRGRGDLCGGRRRSELVALRVEDLQPVGDDYLLMLRTSKTDQEGKGQHLPVKGRAASALRDWLTVADLESGPIFRVLNRWGQVGGSLSPQTVRDIVRRRAEKAGFDPSEFGAHWLRRRRRGFRRGWSPVISNPFPHIK